MKEENRSEWYGKIEEIKILTGSSGSFQLEIKSALISKKNMDKLLKDLLILIRAPESVEADYEN